MQNGPLILPDQILPEGVVIVEGQSIVDVHPSSASKLDADEVVDLNGCFLAPGLIDIHIHGSDGIDLMAASGDDLLRLSQSLLSRGVTRYLPTTVPADEREFLTVIKLVSQYIRQQPTDGARVMGLHFEGPFVNPDRCGALPVEHFRTFTSPPAAAIFLDESLAERLPVRMMTLAPEIEGGLALVEALSNRGYVVAIGHSQASFETCDRAAAVGARHVTHFPNALAPLHHRRVGVFGWTLLRHHVTLGVIADGVHLDWRMIDLIRQLKSPDHMALISDAIAPAGLGDGDYVLWGETIRVSGGRTQNSSGALAGSVIHLGDAVRFLSQRGAPLVEAIKAASLIPARILGIDTQLGSIEKGKRADFVCFDGHGNIRFTCVNGQMISEAQHSAGRRTPDHSLLRPICTQQQL